MHLILQVSLLELNRLRLNSMTNTGTELPVSKSFNLFPNLYIFRVNLIAGNCIVLSPLCFVCIEKCVY